jgi:hypothetical protein
MDVALVADIAQAQVDEFAAALRGEFYVDAEVMKEALIRGRSFNLIHLESVYKFDIFPLRPDEYSKTSFGRRRYTDVGGFGPEPIECAVAAPEDTLLRKLEWYRAGGGTSERQWNDMRGVLKVSGRTLDYTYMREWAKILNVDDLLEKLLAE